ATARRRGRWCSSSALVCRGSSTRGVREAEAPASSRAWARRGLNGDEGRGDGSTSRALVLVERNTCTKKGRGTRGRYRTPLFPSLTCARDTHKPLRPLLGAMRSYR